jgi:hypothetical protein
MKIVCKMCGVEFNASPYEIRRGRKYCSHECNGIANGFKRFKEHSPGFINKIGTDSDKMNTVIEEIKDATFDLSINPFLAKIRKSISATGHYYMLNDVGVPVGEYDWDVNLKEY